MANDGCHHCGSWTVAGGNYCHNCGHSLAPMAFQSSLAIKSPYTPQNRELGQISGQWKDKAATSFMLALAMGSGAVFAGFPPSLVAIVPAGFLLWPAANKMILDLMGKLPEKPHQAATVLKLEHKTLDNRHWILDDFPQNIDLKQLQYIAKKCLDPPEGEGASFSRPELCEAGILSQGQFRDLKKFFLKIHFVFHKNAAAPSMGVVLTERASRLLKKALNESADSC